MAAPAAAALATIGVAGKAAVDSASRLEQAIGATDSVFGKNAATIKRWGENSATSVGVAKSEYLELSNVLGAQLKNMGVPLDQVTGKTRDLIKTGADLAATYGGDTKTAVEALTSAMRGETDPIEKYGISIKQADVNAVLARKGLDDLTGAAGKAARTQALLGLVTKQSADAQGAFKRETDTAAHAQQVAAAQYENTKAALGEALLPVMTQVMDKLAEFTVFIQEHKTATQILIAVVAALAVGVLAVNAAFAVWNAGVAVATAATWLWNNALRANPLGAIITVVLLVAAAFVVLYKRSETFRNVVNAVWSAVKTGAAAVAKFITAVFGVAWKIVSTYVSTYYKVVRAIFNGIRAAVKAVASFISASFRAAYSAVASRATALRSSIAAAMDRIRAAIKSVTDFLRSNWSSAFSAARSAGTTIKNAIVSAFNAIGDAVDRVIGKVQDLINWIKNRIPKLPSLPGFGRSSSSRSLSYAKSGSLTRSGYGGLVPVVGPYSSGTAFSSRSGDAKGASVQITVNGAIDPVQTARQIGRILDGQAVRSGVRYGVA
jgi:phage-related protein